MDLHRTPLYQKHVDSGAKMVPFGGWEMPLQYASVLEEHDYNRKQASLFDCSHMGQFFIKGNPQDIGFDQLVTQNLVDMPIQSCRYGAMLNDQAGVIDDLIVYRLEKEYWMAVVNAANIEKDFEHVKKHLTDSSLIENRSFKLAKLDVQGPLSRDILTQHIPSVEKLDYYTCEEFDLLGEKAIVSRTGYTGELGYEIYYPWAKAERLWDALLQDELIKPTGLAVRDVLRTEMCYSLYGHELSDSINPLTAGLKPFVDFDKDFIGKSALEHLQDQGLTHKVVYLQSETRRSPREGYQIFNEQEISVGKVTSGTFSPALNCGIGIGIIAKEYAKVGNNVFFGNQKLKQPAILVKRPFYKEGSLKT